MTTIFWISFGLLWIIVAILGLAFLEMLRQVGQLRKQIGPQQGVMIMQGAIKAGDPLPQLTGITATGLRSANWEDYLDPHFSVVILLSTHCITCRAIAFAIAIITMVYVLVTALPKTDVSIPGPASTKKAVITVLTCAENVMAASVPMPFNSAAVAVRVSLELRR
jgi:hypothetical protein